MISEETKAYYDLKKRNDVRESAKRIRRQFLRYKDAEIVYSLQHKKILELAILIRNVCIIFIKMPVLDMYNYRNKMR